MNNAKDLNRPNLTVRMGERLRESRLRKGYTAKEVCKSLGIAQSALCQIEKGQISPSVYNMLRLCTVYEVSPSYVMLLDSSPVVDKQLLVKLLEY